MPSGGTALRSMATFSSLHAGRADFGSSTTPAAPAAMISVRSRDDGGQVVGAGDGDGLELRARARAGDGLAGAAARASCREPTRTCAPCRASSSADALADRPGAAQHQAPGVRPGRGASPATRTAAAAVVLAPLASSSTETRSPNAGIMALTRLGEQLLAGGDVAAADEDGGALQVAGPRVKMAPWTRPATCSGLTPP